MKDLTTSQIARKNVLNNDYAIANIESHLQLGGFSYEGETVFTKAQVAEILEVDIRTIERYLNSNATEFKENGYKVLTSKAIKQLRFEHATDTDVGTLNPSTTVLGVLSFRALLNMAMLVTESPKAKLIRGRILDIVLDVVAKKAGGHTKYINQRDNDYLPAALEEESYRKKFTSALSRYLEMGNHKYAIYTDKIYRAIFLENAREYKKILKLADTDKTRDTMYAEVLKAIASFENGLAEQMKAQSESLGRKLLPKELDKLIDDATSNPFLKPTVDDARQKMASRDLGFRDVLHDKLEHYIKEVPRDDFKRFLGEKSRSLEEQLSDPKILSILKRLKDR
ncbi:DNA-binding protein [Francisella tularensis]|uniref:DNA-binding protein n=1 Tax=Francisella tularensis TaxID=263 RepID=UPI001F246AAE|nr:DNA-binding protein [Francisella tularensis]